MELQISLPTASTEIISIAFLNQEIAVPTASHGDGQWITTFDTFGTIVEKLHEHPSVVDILNFSSREITLKRHPMEPWETLIEKILIILSDANKDTIRSVNITGTRLYPLNYIYEHILMFVNPST